MRQPSEACTNYIKSKESFVPIVAPDPVGIPTGGWGHTKGVKIGEKVDEEKGLRWFSSDLATAITTIYLNLPIELIEALPSLCYDALVSFIFNTGNKAFRDPKTGQRTTFWKTITTDLSGIAKQMRRWTHATDERGKLIELPGLVTRRAEESEMWSKGLACEVTLSSPIAEAPEAGVAPAVPPPEKPAPSASVGAAAGLTGLVGAGTVLVQSATQLGTSHTEVSSGMLALVGVLIIAGVLVLAWAAWRTHRPKG